MPATKTATASVATVIDSVADLRKQYGCGPIEFTGTDNALYERHLIFDNVTQSSEAGPREKFEAFARSAQTFFRSAGSKPKLPMNKKILNAFTISRWSF